MPYRVKPGIYRFKHKSEYFKAGDVLPDNHPAVKPNIGKFMVVPMESAFAASASPEGSGDPDSNLVEEVVEAVEEAADDILPPSEGSPPNVIGREFIEDNTSDQTFAR